MNSMFTGARAFNQNIGGWNTAMVSNMNRMFYSAAAFNQNIASWNTAKVSDMTYMFHSAAAFNQNIATWNVLSVMSASGTPPLPPSLRLVASQPAPCRRQYVFGRAASDVRIRHVPPTELSLGWQASSLSPSA
jgi:surface protein